MFINKAANGANNICGRNVCLFRKNLGISQRELADRLQVNGLDVDKNAIQIICSDLQLQASWIYLYDIGKSQNQQDLPHTNGGHL